MVDQIGEQIIENEIIIIKILNTRHEYYKNKEVIQEFSSLNNEIQRSHIIC